MLISVFFTLTIAVGGTQNAIVVIASRISTFLKDVILLINISITLLSSDMLNVLTPNDMYARPDVHITKTRPCNIQILVVKIENFQ